MNVPMISAFSCDGGGPVRVLLSSKEFCPRPLKNLENLYNRGSHASDKAKHHEDVTNSCNLWQESSCSGEGH
jgi:hypothetical protein